MERTTGFALLLMLLLAGGAAADPCREEERIRKLRDLSALGGAVPVAGGRAGSNGEERNPDGAPSQGPGEGTATRQPRPPATPTTPNRRCEQ